MTTTPSLSLQPGHIGLNVSDIARSKAFYRQVFGFDVLGEGQELGREFVFLARDGKLMVTLWQQSDGRFDKAVPGLHHLAFQVASLDEVRAYEQRLHELGAHFLYNSVVPHGEGADSGGVFFEDPDGIRLEIYSPTGAAGHTAPTSGAPSCGFF
jgi:lactoylglutathione lyase